MAVGAADSIHITTLFNGPHAQTAVEDYHYHDTNGTVTQDDLNACVANWISAVLPSRRSMLAQNWAIAGVRATPDLVPEGIKSETLFDVPQTGTWLINADANGVSGVVPEKTDETGGSKRGRDFLAGIPASVISQDYITHPTWLTDLALYLVQLFHFDPLALGHLGLWQVYSKKLHTTRHINTAAIDALIGYQRRRTRNRGHKHHAPVGG